jgi:hypothetical protein
MIIPGVILAVIGIVAGAGGAVTAVVIGVPQQAGSVTSYGLWQIMGRMEPVKVALQTTALSADEVYRALTALHDGETGRPRRVDLGGGYAAVLD